MQATFTLKDQEFMCIDSNVKHQFTFDHRFQFFLTCDSEEEIDRLYSSLTDGGQVMMPLGDYFFSRSSAGYPISLVFPGSLLSQYE